MSINNYIKMVRANIVVLGECSKLDNGVGVQAYKELNNEIRLLAVLREYYFGVLVPVGLEPRVFTEALEFGDTFVPPTLEEKRKWLAAVPFHEEYFTPCRIMWIKVIIRAAYDYALWKNSTDLRQHKAAVDAEKWLFGESELLNGFKSICFLCRLPRENFLGWARNLTRDQVKKFEFLERNGKDPVTLALQKKADDGLDS